MLVLCTEFNLFTSRTQFKHRGDHLTTWMHPRSQQWRLIDYVIVRKRNRQDVHKVRFLPGVGNWTDHALVRAKQNFVLKSVAKRRQSQKLPTCLHVGKHSPEPQKLWSNDSLKWQIMFMWFPEEKHLRCSWEHLSENTRETTRRMVVKPSSRDTSCI